VDTLSLTDIRFFGRHGVTPAEKSVGAWFSVDVEMALDLTPASISDELASTVDYGAIAQLVADIGTGRRVNLIERLAGMIAEELLKQFPTDDVRVRVRKITAPLAGLTGTPGVDIRRKR
jgi:dihydroneopterin aldolase